MGWESAQDDKGKTYYFNRDTGETSWKKPAEMAPVPVEAKKDKRRSKRESSKRGGMEKKKSKRQSSRSSRRMDGDVGSDLFSSSSNDLGRGSRMSQMSDLSGGESG